MSANNQALKQIKTYLQSQNKQSISQQELKTEQSPKKNYWPWVIGGVGVLGIVGVVVYFFTKNKKRGEE